MSALQGAPTQSLRHQSEQHLVAEARREFQLPGREKEFRLFVCAFATFLLLLPALEA